MLSSRFLAVSFLYIFYAAGLVAADPQRNPIGGGEQFCQSVRTVTITQTVAPGKPSPSSGKPSPSSARTPPLPALTTRPGNVNLGNGPTSSVVKNTKKSSIKVNTKTSSTKLNTKTSSTKLNTKTSSTKLNTKTSSTKLNTKTSSTKLNTKTSSTKPSTKTSSVNTRTNTVNTKTNVNTNTKTVNTKTRDVNTKTSSILTSSTGLPATSLPPVSSSSTAAPPAQTDTGNPATSLTLDPSVIQNVNGKGQAAGEADSLVSPNNFIGICVGKTITNGKQVKEGSCNPVPMGDIPSVDNMPSAKFNFPKNFDTIAANTPFTISLQVRNLVTGTFTNAANTYYAAPQQLVNGVIQGHSHVTVQTVTSLGATQPLDPKIFAFFKGLNAASPNGVLTADVSKGLPAGVYRLSSINSAGNHQEALGPVAQRGSFNDVVYFTVTEDGEDANANSPSAVPPAPSDVSSTSVVDPTATLSDVSSTPPAVPSPTDKGGKDPKNSSTPALPVVSSTPPPVPTKAGGKGTIVSSSAQPPVSTSKGGQKGGKGGDATPPVGNGKTDTKNGSTPAGKGNGGGGSGQNSKRMHKRSRHA